MRLSFIKIFIILGLLMLSSFAFAKKAEAQVEEVNAAPIITGFVQTAFGAGIEGVWVRWTDNMNRPRRVNNIRYTQTRADGSFYFASWQLMSRDARKTEFDTLIDTNLDGKNDARMASTLDSNAFGCAANPHEFTAVVPYNWFGTFSVVNGVNLVDFPNGVYVKPLDPIIWIPMPQIKTLYISNATVPSVTGPYGTSGKTAVEQGVNWLNPINIILDATPGTETETQKTKYFMGFYTGALITDKNVFVSTLISRLNADPKSGVLLAYDTGNPSAGPYFVYDPAPRTRTYIDITPLADFGQTIKDLSGKNIFIAYPSLNNLPRVWRIEFYEDFGSKPMKTGVFVIDANNQSDYNSNITPSP